MMKVLFIVSIFAAVAALRLRRDESSSELETDSNSDGELPLPQQTSINVDEGSLSARIYRWLSLVSKFNHLFETDSDSDDELPLPRPFVNDEAMERWQKTVDEWMDQFQQRLRRRLGVNRSPLFF